jgi:hypothetical protein
MNIKHSLGFVKPIYIAFIPVLAVFIFLLSLFGVLDPGGPSPGNLFVWFIVSVGMVIVSIFFVHYTKKRSIVVLISSLIFLFLVVLSGSGNHNSFLPNFCQLDSQLRCVGTRENTGFSLDEHGTLSITLTNLGATVRQVNVSLKSEGSEVDCVPTAHYIDVLPNGQSEKIPLCQFSVQEGRYDGRIYVTYDEGDSMLRSSEGVIHFSLKDVKERNDFERKFYFVMKNIGYNIFGITE